MSRLTQIHKKIRSNFNAFLSDKKQLELLAINIRLFEEIPDSYLNKFFRNAPVFVFAENNAVLLIIAYSYVHYSLENKENINLDDLLVLLNKANDCFQRIINSYKLLPPAQLSQKHSEQLLIANFELHKIKFLKAEMRLFFIEKEATNEIENLAFIRRELTNIIDEYAHFESILDKQYKDSFLREKLSINNKLLRSIQEGLSQAENLLDTLPQQQSRKRRLSAAILENKCSTQKHIEDSSKVKRKKQKVKNNNQSNSARLNQVQQMNSDNGNNSEENDLATLSAAVEVLTHNESEMISPSISHPVVAAQVFWSPPPIPKSVEDSKRFLIEFKKWAHVYFNIKNYYSEIETTEKSLEKIAHSLLYAAVILQKESSVFKGEKSNPVIQTAIQLLLYISTKGAQTNSEAVEKLNNLSKTYAPLLKPFIRSFLHIVPEKFISHLRIQFTPGNSSNISFRGLETQGVVEQLFKHFETVLTADDYERVMNSSLDCFTRAHDKLIEGNTVQFNPYIFNG